VFTQWRQLKHVKIFIHRQIKRSELEASEPLPENKSLDSLKLTPLCVHGSHETEKRLSRSRADWNEV
jgi:hypothetical protein